MDGARFLQMPKDRRRARFVFRGGDPFVVPFAGACACFYRGRGASCGGAFAAEISVGESCREDCSDAFARDIGARTAQIFRYKKEEKINPACYGLRGLQTARRRTAAKAPTRR